MQYIFSELIKSNAQTNQLSRITALDIYSVSDCKYQILYANGQDVNPELFVLGLMLCRCMRLWLLPVNSYE